MANKRQRISLFLSNHRRKRFKHHATPLERLPNELLIDVFSYLSDVHAVCAFSQLNDRFRQLLANYCTTFDLKSVSKAKCKLVIQQHETQRWQALRLSDDDDTPGYVTSFLQLYSLEEDLPRLKTLSLVDTNPRNTQIIVLQLRPIRHLVSLTLGNVCGKFLEGLELSSLKHLVINSCPHSEWMKSFSQLESLQHTIEHTCHHEHSLVWPEQLKRLRIFYAHIGDSIMVITALRSLSHLDQLAVCDSAWKSPLPDGQKWEKLIVASFPSLKSFQFCFKFWKGSSVTNNLNRVLTSFSTPFYLEEKRLFVRCDAHEQQFSVAVLYSLPFAFERFEIVTNSLNKSVLSSNASKLNGNIFSRVRSLVVNVKCDELDSELVCENVKNLSLNSYRAPADWIFNLTQLRQLSLSSQVDMSPTDFSRLLIKTSCLSSLTVLYKTLQCLTNSWTNKAVCNQLSYKIRSLSLQPDQSSCSESENYVKVQELLPIVRIFGKRCQHFTVTVYSRNLVAGLIIRIMNRLHSLRVHLIEHGDLKITKQWLREQDVVLKNLDYSMTMNGNEYRFWFGDRY